MLKIIVEGQDKADLINNLSQWIETLASPNQAASAEPEKKTRAPRGSKAKAAEPAPAEAEGPSKDTVREACQKAIDTHGEAPVMEVFKLFKAAKLKDVGEKNWPKLLEKLAELDELAGEDDKGNDDFDL